MKKLILFAFLIAFAAVSCRKNTIYTDKNLTFSADTIVFDTIFTTVGSATKRLKFYNDNALPIKVEEIELMGGESSPFNINVDGTSGHLHKDLDVQGRDSLFLFVEVTLSINEGTLPLIVEDSIRFRTNGVDQYVNLAVWGQDAYFHNNEIVQGVWPNDKPHVIYGVAGVGFPGVDSNLNLTIPAGTEVYFHKRAFLYVYKSSIDVQGQLNNEVEFRHDRLESFYDDNSGQWGGVWLVQANPSTIDYAIIRNAEIGLRVDTLGNGGGPVLEVRNTIIQNSQFYNLFLVAGPYVVAENCVFGDAGLISTYLFAGGEAQFRHCNFVNYWNGSRGGPAFAIKNWWEFEDVIYARGVLNTKLENCVMYGNTLTEFVIDTLAQSSAPFDFTTTSCLMRREEPYEAGYNYLLNTIWNQNPLFMDTELKDFHFDESSPLDNAGSATVGVLFDIEGNSRNASAPDIGAFEN